MLEPYLNPTDITVAVLILLGTLGGARRGLSGELARLISMVITFVLAWKFYGFAAEQLARLTGREEEDLKIIGFIAIVAVAYTLLAILRHSLRLFLDFSFKGKLELLGGALFGFARSIVFCIAVLFAAALIPSQTVQDYLQASRSGTAVAHHLVPYYEEWAEENPDFKLPAVDRVEDNPFEQPLPWDDYLGPLIEKPDGE